MKSSITAIAIAAFTVPAFAGGPVIIEDQAEEAPVVRDRNNVLPLILLGVAVALIVSGGGSHNCNGDEGEPTPEPVC